MSRILVVEDSRTQAMQIQLLLEEAGFEVSHTHHGGEALDALKESLPDVVLTDLDMPVMNGLELVEAVRRDYPAVPVVLMTALGSEEIAVQALQKGAASYIPKRIMQEELISTLESVISVARASQQEKRALSCLTEADFHFVLDNDIRLWAVHPCSSSIFRPGIVRLHHCDRTELMRVGIALQRALLLNAIQHGNLEVSSDLRQSDGERLHRPRRREPPNAVALSRAPRPRQRSPLAIRGRFRGAGRRSRFQHRCGTGPSRPSQHGTHRRSRADAHSHLHGRRRT